MGGAGLFLQCSSYPECQNPSAEGQNMGAEVTCGGRGVCVSWECLKLCSRVEVLVSSQPIPGSQDSAMAWKQPEAIPLELPLLCVST